MTTCLTGLISYSFVDNSTYIHSFYFVYTDQLRMRRTWVAPLCRVYCTAKKSISYIFSLSLVAITFVQTNEPSIDRSIERVREREREKEKNTRRWQSFLKVKETSFASFSFFLKVFSLPVHSRVVSYSWSVESVCAYKARHCRRRSKEEEEKKAEKKKERTKENSYQLKENERQRQGERERENERKRWNIFSFLTSTFKFQSFAWKATEERVGDEFRKGNYHHSLLYFLSRTTFFFYFKLSSDHWNNRHSFSLSN